MLDHQASRNYLWFTRKNGIDIWPKSVLLLGCLFLQYITWSQICMSARDRTFVAFLSRGDFAEFDVRNLMRTSANLTWKVNICWYLNQWSAATKWHWMLKNVCTQKHSTIIKTLYLYIEEKKELLWCPAMNSRCYKTYKCFCKQGLTHFKFISFHVI